MKSIKLFPVILILAAFIAIIPSRCPAATELDPYQMQDVFCRFPFAKLVPLDNGHAWGLIYADVYGKIYLKRATDKGWKREWELTNLGTKVRKFFIVDVDADGVQDIVIATVSGRLLVYRMDNFQNTWENIEDNFTSIEAIDVKNIDSDPQLEFVMLADKKIYIIDAKDKHRQWISEREFEATELLVDNIDKDDPMEIILNTGIVIDSKFRIIDIEWDRPFGDRIATFDINSDGYKDIIGEFSDYSLQIFDTKTEREVW